MRQSIHKNEFILLCQTSQINALCKPRISILSSSFGLDCGYDANLTAPLLASLLQNS